MTTRHAALLAGTAFPCLAAPIHARTAAQGGVTRPGQPPSTTDPVTRVAISAGGRTIVARFTLNRGEDRADPGQRAETGLLRGLAKNIRSRVARFSRALRIEGKGRRRG